MYTRPHLTLEHILPFTLTPSLIVPIVAGALGLVLLIAALSIARSRARQRALSRRVAYDVLPANSFDPRAEDVHRYARILQRIAAPSPGLTSRHAPGVRIKMLTTPAGLTYRVEGPKTVATLTQQAYAGIELRAVITAPPDDEPDQHDDTTTSTPAATMPQQVSDTASNGATS